MVRLNKMLNRLTEMLNEPISKDWCLAFDGKRIYFQIPPFGNWRDVKDISLNKKYATTARYWRKVLASEKFDVYRLDDSYKIVDENGLCLSFSQDYIAGVSKSDYLFYQDNKPYVRKLR